MTRLIEPSAHRATTHRTPLNADNWRALSPAIHARQRLSEHRRDPGGAGGA